MIHKLASIWGEIPLLYGDIIFETDAFVVKDWETSTFGKFRGLLFKSSSGIEGGQTVSCIDDKPDQCTSDWEFGTKLPAFEYLHTTLMSFFAFSPESCPNEHKKKFLHIGVGSGTAISWLEHFAPLWENVGVDILSDVIYMVEKYFNLNSNDRTTFIHADANDYFAQKCSNAKFDGIFLDAYNENDELVSCTRKPKIISPCLADDNSIVVINFVFETSAMMPDVVPVVHDYMDEFENVIIVEASKHHKILVATNREFTFSQEEFFYRTEHLKSVCSLPHLTRGRGFMLDTKSVTKDELNSWFIQVQHEKRNLQCSGFSCLMF